MNRRNTRIVPITEISHEPSAPTFENKQKPHLSGVLEPFIEPPGITVANEYIPTRYVNIELFTRKPKTSNRNHFKLFKESRTVKLTEYRNNNRETHGIIKGLLKEVDTNYFLNSYKSVYNIFLTNIIQLHVKIGSHSAIEIIKKDKKKLSKFNMSIEELENTIILITNDVHQVSSMKYLSYNEISIILLFISLFIKYYFPNGEGTDKLNHLRRLYSYQCFFYMLFTSFGIKNEIINRLIENMKTWDYNSEHILYENFILYCQLILLYTPLDAMNVYKTPIERNRFTYTEDFQFFINKLSLLNICFYNSNTELLDITLEKLIGIDKMRAVIIPGGTKEKKRRLKKYN